MKRSGFSYLKVTAVVAVLAMTLIGLSGLLSVTTTAQERETTPPREIDLRAKLKDKTFADGRRVTIETLASGEKIVAEVKAGKFVNLFLVGTDGTEVQGVVKKKTKDTLTSTCTMTVNQTTTTHRLIRKDIVTTSSTVVQIPCPSVFEGDTFK